MEQTTKSAIATAIENGAVSITVLQGKAPEPVNETGLHINGAIDAPLRYCEARKNDITKESSHAKVSISDGVIVFVADDRMSGLQKQINGKISFGKLFAELGINADRAWSPQELSKKLRLLRSIFPKPVEHMKLVKDLRNLKAKVNQDLENNDDQRGNKSVKLDQTLESNIPEQVTFKLPLIEGDDPDSIGIQVLLVADNALHIQCYLESIDAAELIDQRRDKAVRKIADQLEEFTTVIYC